MRDWILIFLVAFPFLAGLLTYSVGRLTGKKEASKGITKEGQICAVGCMIVEFALMVLGIYLFCQNSKVVSVPFTENACIFSITNIVPKLCGFGLTFLLDGFRLIYGIIAVFMWMMTTILSGVYFQKHENVNRFYLFLFWTLGATMGVFLSADLYTTFIFFEIMSFTSYVWVAQEENRPSLRASETYLGVAVFGGLVMLMGIFLLYHQLGTVVIADLQSAATVCENKTVLYVAGTCMLVGFGAKAGAFPLHIWLPKAHPVAPAPASALLSGILTKTGIYGILVLSCHLFFGDALWGRLLLALGVITMFGGALLALFSIDLKRTLACSSMSQIGFIMVGVGMQGLLGEENSLAVHGTLLHMINHSLIKLLLFMTAGVIYRKTHALDLNKIRGYGRKKPLLASVFLIGALAIGGIPLFGGYVSKTLLHESILEYGGGTIMQVVEWMFLISGGMTVAYMTKLYIAIFVEKNTDAVLQKGYDLDRGYMTKAGGFALITSALVLFLWGLFPGWSMDRVACLGQGFMNLKEYGHKVAYFSLGNLKGAMISILIGVVIYLFVIRKFLMKKERDGESAYFNAWPDWLDLENMLYRPLLLSVLPFIFGVLSRIADCFADTLVVLLRKSIYRDSPLPHERTEGNAITDLLGSILNAVEKKRNSLQGGDATVTVNYRHFLAMKNEAFKENNRIIERSLSFGLLLFGVGLIITLIYLIWY